MVDFPENGAKVFELADFFRSFERSDVRSVFEDVRSALGKVVEPFDSHPRTSGEDVSDPPPALRDLAVQVTAARRELLSFLQDPAMTMKMPALGDAYAFMTERKFGAAHDALAGVGSHPAAGQEVLPRNDRFPVEGTWQVELLDVGQFPQLDDLRLFVMYSYQ